MSDYTYFKELVALHVLAELQQRLREEAKVDPSCNAPLWCLTKLLLGDEHAQVVFEMDFPKEVLDHDLLYGKF